MSAKVLLLAAGWLCVFGVLGRVSAALAISARQSQKDVYWISIRTIIGAEAKGRELNGFPRYVFLPLEGRYRAHCWSMFLLVVLIWPDITLTLW